MALNKFGIGCGCCNCYAGCCGPCGKIVYASQDVELVIRDGTISGIGCGSTGSTFAIGSTLGEFVYDDPFGLCSHFQQDSQTVFCTTSDTAKKYQRQIAINLRWGYPTANDILIQLTINYSTIFASPSNGNIYQFEKQISASDCALLLSPIEIPFATVGSSGADAYIYGDEHHPQIDKVLWNLNL